MMSPSVPMPISFTITSDASGAWGCGAYCNDQWFQLAWPEAVIAQLSIMFKELVPIVVAVAVWGQSWTNCSVMSRCDNMAVVEVLRTRTTKEKDVMHLLRCLHFFEAHFECRVQSVHIQGIDNDRADDLSSIIAFIPSCRKPRRQADFLQLSRLHFWIC